MKKVFSVIGIALLALVLVYGGSVRTSEAYVSGVCANCHTMHNSQGGANVAKDSTGALTATPNGHLTLSTCIGCHGSQAADGLTTVGGAPSIFKQTGYEAGGTFNSLVVGVASGDGKFGHKTHNVRDIDWTGMDESDLAGTTPGGAGGLLAGKGATSLNCAGLTGCHGDHTKTGSDAGIRGYHHNKTNTAYRFLTTQAGDAVLGKGSASWEGNKPGGAALGATNHNVYSSDGTAGISKLCASCHGGFHSTANTQTNGAWVRHPTDVALTGLMNFNAANIAVDYSNTPFGYADVSGLSSTVALTTDNAQVVCVSCHRAHGSANDDLLRFDYTAQIAGSGGTTGCLNCHAAQR